MRMLPDWEIEYLNWLATENLSDTPDRREAFQTGYEWATLAIRERFLKNA